MDVGVRQEIEEGRQVFQATDKTRCNIFEAQEQGQLDKHIDSAKFSTLVDEG